MFQTIIYSAERIASERCEEVGTTVGYNVRLDSRCSNQTQLLFVTPGVLLRRFQSDPELGEFTHVIIDEIHERDKYTEFLMIALRELMNRRKDLTVVLMSATIQTNELMEYWSSAGSFHAEDNGDDSVLSEYDDRDQDHRPAEINIPGRTFPVQEFFLEDVLTMTGFVNDSSTYFGDGMDELESNLAALLNKQGINNGQKKNIKNSIQSQPGHTIELSLTCPICNKKGFQSAEEFGAHVALCDGGGQYDAIALEEKVRNVDVSLPKPMENSGDNEEDFIEYMEEEEEEEEQQTELDNDDIDGLRMGKWDGESPFGVADNIEIGNQSTLTEEELLNRYQTVHDDERIDNELVVEIMKYICKSSFGDGAILIFLPGWQEISELTLLLENTAPFWDNSKYSVLPLHSGIPSREQRLVFQRPRQGIRKIVLATNIAETSITIDDVAFVIDSGRAKEKVSIIYCTLCTNSNFNTNAKL